MVFLPKFQQFHINLKFQKAEAWDIVGELLSNGSLESIHDEFTGEMKLCETGKIYSIMDLERKRKREKFSSFKKKRK